MSRKFVVLLTTIVMLCIMSCQSEIEQADALRLDNEFEQSSELYEKLANQGDAYAMWRLSNAYYNGDGIEFDREKGFEWLNEAADKGCEQAICDLARTYLFGLNGVEKDEGKAKQMLDKLLKETNNSYVLSRYARMLLAGTSYEEKNEAKTWKLLKEIDDDNEPFYLFTMGFVYLFGVAGQDCDYSLALGYLDKSFKKGFKDAAVAISETYLNDNDVAIAVEWLKKGVQGNSTKCMEMLSDIYINTDRDSNYSSYENVDKGIELLERAAKHGSADAYCQLGRVYYFGDNIDVNTSKVIEYDKKAYELGSADGACNYGADLMSGTGCDKDVIKGVEIYKQAVDMGSGFAAKNLYFIYRHGQDGYAVDYELAKQYLQKGVDLGDIESMFLMSKELYPDGELFDQNAQLAFSYAKRAAEKGNKEACARVAWFYDNGIGCDYNPQKAQEYRDKYEVQKND